MFCEAVDMNLDVTARPRTAGLACKFCGCTDDNACPGPCRWVSIDPPICSACAGKEAASQLVLPATAGLFTAQNCPGSATPALHCPIFIDHCSGYCARCQEGFEL
ncbi:hypothetical protein [Bradyrhizobium sp. BR 10261]|uniref:hypothetical protein n=1 Tax=Bradyrhizobium sp. BR 10261 TaxID=2749992 RepID=UPI001C650A85|nr:hypothetical protein [Bradyrhizobium sp. BR 10261]MBW7965286.1 hypothetical protein [Bradyrhizobium sp. BR 10261]